MGVVSFGRGHGCLGCPSAVRLSAASRLVSTRELIILKDFFAPLRRTQIARQAKVGCSSPSSRGSVSRLIAGLSVTCDARPIMCRQPRAKGVEAQLTNMQRGRAQVRDRRLLLCQTWPSFCGPGKGMKPWLGGREVLEAVGENRARTYHHHYLYLHPRTRSEWTRRYARRVSSERDSVSVYEPVVRPCAPTHGGYSGSRMACDATSTVT
jgi:hypothetical protein